MNLINAFENGYLPTNIQIDILNKLDLAIKKNKKFIIISAPTGSGKSFITKTISNYSNDIDPKIKKLIEQNKISDNYCEQYFNCKRGGCFGLTISKNLQNQYKHFFADTYLFKGKNNYKCEIIQDLTCDVGACLQNNILLKDCIIKKQCPYYNARNDIITNKFGILNYSAFLKLPNWFKLRQFIICDEASELEDEIVNNFSLNINYNTLKYFQINITKLNNINNIKIWILELYNQINSEIGILEKKLNNKKLKYKYNSKIIIEYKFLYNLHEKLKIIINFWDKCNYIADKQNDNILLQPIYIQPLTSFIFDFAEHIILMSATIINPKKFAETLGIEDYEYIEVSNVFNPKNAPIYVTPHNELNYKNLNFLLPKLLKQTKYICDMHKNDKGIIHTHTQKITDFFKKKFCNIERFTIRSNDLTNEEVLNIHRNKNNSVIISPSMSFGVDLKDDLARFQIIVKLPYLPLNNKRIEYLAKKDYEWYLMKMLVNLIQSCGRGIRSKNDFCNTYILDSGIIKILLENKNILPTYFIERFM